MQRNLDVEFALAPSKLVDYISESGGSDLPIFVLCLVMTSAVHLGADPRHWMLLPAPLPGAVSLDEVLMQCWVLYVYECAHGPLTHIGFEDSPKNT